MRFFVIRHGETEWNTRLCLQGHKGTVLTEQGIKLTEITAKALSEYRIDLCYTSSLERSIQTAEILTAGRNIPIRIDDRLMEIGFGEYEGLSTIYDVDKLPEGFSFCFRKKPFEYKAPWGGETVFDVIRRSEEFLRELISDPELQDKSILLCSHACSSRALLYYFSLDKSEYWGGDIIPNCAVSIIDVDGNGKGTVIEKDRLYYTPTSTVNYFQN